MTAVSRVAGPAGPTGPAGPKGDPGPAGPALTNRGRRYARLGAANTGYTTPDAASLDITGALDLRARVVPDSWASGAVQVLISKWAGVQCSYQLIISADGHLGFVYTANGSTQRTIQSLVLLSSATGQTPTSGLPVWLRAYAIPDNGSSQSQASFYYTTVVDPASGDWTALDTITNANVASSGWFSGSAAVYVGQVTAGTSRYAGRLYQANVYNDATLVAAFDARGASDPPATFTDTLGKVWTPLASASLIPDGVSGEDIDRDKTVPYSRVIGGPAGFRPSGSIPVAAADRTEDVKEACTASGGYACTGTDDHVQIQAAIDALAATTKPALVKYASGVVELVGLKFVVGSDIKGKSGIRLVGSGSSNTTIIPQLTWGGTYIIKLDAVNVERFGVTDLSVDGRKADGIVATGMSFDNTAGSFIVGPDARHLVRDVQIHDCSGSGFILGINCRGSRVYDLDVFSCGQHGFYLSATDCKVMGVRHSACGTDDGLMAYYGIACIGSNNQIIDFKANFQRGHNVYVDGTLCYLQGQSQDAWGAGLYLTANSGLVSCDIGADSNGMQPQAGITGSDANIYDNGVQNTIRGTSRDRGFAESQVDISGNVGNRTAYGLRVGSGVSRPVYDLQVRNMRKGTFIGTTSGLNARVMITAKADTESDVQVVTLKNATGGTFRLTDTDSGQQTAAITFSTTAATLQSNAQTALQALAALGSNVTVNSASFAYQFKIVLGGSLANTFRSTFTVDGSSLTGTSVSSQINHAIEGGARTSEARIANSTLVTT